MSIIGSLSSLLHGKTRRASSRRRRTTCRRSLRLEALETRRLFTVDSATLACEPADDIATLAESDPELSGSVPGDAMLYCEPVESYTDEGTSADLSPQEYLLDDSTIDAIIETDPTLASVEVTTVTNTSLYRPVSDTTLSGTMQLGLLGPSMQPPVLVDLQVVLLEDGLYQIEGRVQHTYLSSVSVVLSGLWQDSSIVRADGTFTFYKPMPSGIIRGVITTQAFAMGAQSDVWKELI